ncbi:hypothetical protein [Rhodobacter calidifons]|uniref:SnoaL-like protein n=1 Tax=Rhodobacter calidifons TaxID=2715277 RepID=A0ABX0G5Q1_9RHOB|nr:hypothetical protein [Rhodobacter calidifons]NHB76297.1 hypothetical protein [Rhodobacter calidifons]
MNALDIYQQALNAVSQTVLNGDFDGYARRIDLPYLIHTETARLLVTSGDDLRPTFDTLHQTLKDLNVTHYERVAREAEYVDCDRIEGWHHTHLISHGERVACPHASRHAIVRRGEVWLFSEAHYQIRADRWPITRDVLLAQFGRRLSPRDLT